jgi:Holliday junction resolvase RusA-like endonuclease
MTQVQREFWQATSFQFPSETNPRAMRYRVAAFEQAFPGVPAPSTPENANVPDARAPEPVHGEFQTRTISMTFHGLVPTINTLHNPRIITKANGEQFVTMILSKLGREFKKKAALEFDKQLKRSGYQKPEGITFWYLHISIFKPWLNLDGTVKEEDASNRIKALEDAVKEATGIDDRYFWVCQVEKWHTRENPRAVVTLEEMSREEVMD